MRKDITSYAELRARPKVSNVPRTPPMFFEDRNRESAPIPHMTMERPSQEIWDQLEDKGRETGATRTAVDAITKVKERVRMRKGLHMTRTMVRHS